MSLVSLIQCSPPDQPGSMQAYGQMVQGALQTQTHHGIQLRMIPFYDPRGGASMWRHHRWRLLNARSLLRQYPGETFHLLDGSMAGLIPRSYLKRTFITVHDMIPLLQLRGELPGRKPSIPAQVIIRQSVAALSTCRAVCADSNCTQRDVERFSGRSRVAVIPLAVKSFSSARTMDARDIPGPYLLHVGNNADYKNRIGVVDVFSKLHDMASLHLVMAGPPPTEALRERATRMKRVIFVNDIADGDLAYLYQHAAAFVFPSLYEGFGMPVLEAMAAGCPVICSTGGSLPEVAGEAALTAPVGDIEALADCCRVLLNDPALRDHMVEKGKARAAMFSLEEMGKKLVTWYQRWLIKA